MKELNEREQLARYLFSKNHYRPSDRTVKHSAFIPPPDKKLSVFQITDLPEIDIWSMGENLRDRLLVGRADILAGYVYKADLSIDLDNNPPKHANIIGWPDEPSAVKLRALELAEQATLHLKQI
jgi:hypothetical protein